MKKGDWTLLSNHGRIVHYLASHPKCTVQTIARETALSIGAVQKIISTLNADGYITRTKDGRSNHCTVHTMMPMRHRLERKHTVGELLTAFGAMGGQQRVSPQRYWSSLCRVGNHGITQNVILGRESLVSRD